MSEWMYSSLLCRVTNTVGVYRLRKIVLQIKDLSSFFCFNVIKNNNVTSGTSDEAWLYKVEKFLALKQISESVQGTEKVVCGMHFMTRILLKPSEAEGQVLGVGGFDFF